jgi:hypothetical protein
MLICLPTLDNEKFLELKDSQVYDEIIKQIGPAH